MAVTKSIQDGAGNPFDMEFDDAGIGLRPVHRSLGPKVTQSLTQDDASGGTLTFAANLEYVRIYNTDATNDGVFTINGIAIPVPRATGLETGVAGTPGTTVAVTGSTSYIVQRLT